MGERVINIRDLIVDILLHWRGILLWMFVGGLLFGMIGLAGMWRAAEALQREQLELADAAALRDELTHKELAEVEQVLLGELSLEKNYSDIEHSAFMSLDTSQLYQEDLIYAIAAPNGEGGAAVPAGTYVLLLDTNEMYRFAAGRTDAYTASDIQDLTNIVNLGNMGQGYTSFGVTIFAGTEEACVEITEAVKSYIEDTYRSLSGALGVHELICLRDTMSVTGDLSLLQQQIDARRKLISQQAEVEKLKGAFSKRQRQYYQLRVREVNVQEHTEGVEALEEARRLPGLSACVRQVGWGAFFAVLIYGLALFFRFILDDRLRYTDPCAGMFHVPELGHIPEKREASTLPRRIDRKLYLLRDQRRHTVSAQEALGLAAAAVRMISLRKGIHSVCYVSCSMPFGVAQELEESLKADGLAFRGVGNILYSADSMNLLDGVRAVVLLEKAGAVSCHEIWQELEILRMQKIEILGMVIVE